ncbi:SLATT domain-containing protein [Streptomyces sp. NPDC058221]|uniref:SLATT domain-containing protein n=1 Tax=Streptomyces sp. NPDC058221 TaxID=3346388 RepID=UPI0036EE41CF
MASESIKKTDESDLAKGIVPRFAWSSSEASESTNGLFRWVESEALKAHDWYLVEKQAKSRASKILRIIAIGAVTIGAVLPVVSLLTDGGVRSESGYVALALGGGAMLLDRAFGFSASWTRYMATASSLSKSIIKYQIEWTLWQASNPDASSADTLKAIEDIILPFSNDVAELIELETSSWSSDFSDNLSELHSSLSQ